MNKVILCGNLTRDCEVKNIGTTTLCTTGLATKHKYKSGTEWKEDVCFVDLKLWGKPGQMFAEYFQKGSKVLVEGRLSFEQWEDKQSGAKRSKHTIFVEQFHFVGERKQRQAVEPAQQEVEW